MRNTALSGVVRICRRGKVRLTATLLLVLGVLAFFYTQPAAFAQDSKTPAVLPAPSAGKAIVCIYREGRFTGSSAHDELFVNDVHLGRLLNGEYMFTEVPPGTVVVSGSPKMYYAGGVAMSSYTAINNSSKKENERIRFEAMAGSTYYLKWTSGALATGIKVTLSDPLFGAKEMSKLHLSKPPDDKNKDAKEAEKPEAKDSDKPAPK